MLIPSYGTPVLAPHYCLNDDVLALLYISAHTQLLLPAFSFSSSSFLAALCMWVDNKESAAAVSILVLREALGRQM